MTALLFGVNNRKGRISRYRVNPASSCLVRPICDQFAGAKAEETGRLAAAGLLFSSKPCLVRLSILYLYTDLKCRCQDFF
jgi:hypothetical protein